MNKSLWKTCAILAVIAVTCAFVSCGGGSHKLVLLPDQGGNGTPQSVSPGLVMLKDTAGAPTGIRVYWWRDAGPDVSGYYLYRDTKPITSADPVLRVNGGALIPQPGPSQPSIIFDDLFAASYGETYHYRATTVDIDGEESDLSAEQRITIAQFSISNFSPTQAKVGQYVYINGNYFGAYNSSTDGVFFTGVSNDKGPSALVASFIQAEIVDWTNDKITVRVPLGSTLGPIRVVCNNVSLETATPFTNLSPYILSVSPDPSYAGKSLNILGANFGTPDGANTLIIDGTSYFGLFTAWTGTQATCTLPAGLPTALSRIEMHIGTETTNHYNGVILGADAPVINNISPDYGTAGSTIVTLTGSNFGSDQSHVTAYFHGTLIDNTSFLSFSDTQVTLQVPFSAKRVGDVYLSFSGGFNSNKRLYHTLPGSSPAPAHSIVAGYDMGKYSDVDYSSTDQPYVVFTDNSGGEGTSRLMLGYISGGNWDYVELASYGTAPDCIAYPRVAVDKFGLVHYAYQRGLGGASPTEVRYGEWDGAVALEETVLTGSAGTHHGDYLAMDVLVDSLGGTNKILFWGDNGQHLVGAYKLSGDAVWTPQLVRTADSPSSQVLGYNCSIDLIESPIGTPPTNIWAVASSSDSSKATPAHRLVEASWDVTAGWASIVSSVGSNNTITETCALWSDFDLNPYILWCTNAGVYCSFDLIAGGTTQNVLIADAPFGAALGMREDPLTGNRIVVGNMSETSYFWASYNYALGQWSTDQAGDPSGRRLQRAGRGGAAITSGLNRGTCSVWDPDMRDAIAVEEIKSGGPLGVTWKDIGDNFATPGYDLSNRALVVDSQGVPSAVFCDIDVITGIRSLWYSRYNYVTGASSSAKWQYYLLDTAPSGTLGHASMAIDFNDDIHIAYLKGSDVYYTKGNTITGFSSPRFLETAGAISTAPLISLGVNSALDVNILVAHPATDWELWWLHSADGMVTHNKDLVILSTAAITQYSLAMRGDGNAAVAAFTGAPTIGNRLLTWNSKDGVVFRYDGTANMNSGITISMDDGDKYCVTANDTSTTRNYLLRWNTATGAYELHSFGMADTYASTSTMMSQCRNSLGPVISYTTKNLASPPNWTDLWGYYSTGPSGVNVNPASTQLPAIAPTTYHSIEPISDMTSGYLYYFDNAYYKNLIFTLEAYT
jgi:hypothetical protein